MGCNIRTYLVYEYILIWILVDWKTAPFHRYIATSVKEYLWTYPEIGKVLLEKSILKNLVRYLDKNEIQQFFTKIPKGRENTTTKLNQFVNRKW